MTRTVLIVDDEIVVRALVTRTLKRARYRVREGRRPQRRWFCSTPPRGRTSFSPTGACPG
jgi:hypothetical protein